MNTFVRNLHASIGAASLLLLAACSSGPTKPDGAEAVRDKLTQLQSDNQLASRAPVAIKDAEAAVRAAEVPQDDVELGRHLVVIADRKVDIAWAQAQSRLSEDDRKSLAEQREKARLDSRTREADRARAETARARSDADLAKQETATAQTEAAASKEQAAAAGAAADAARRDATAAGQKTSDLQRQIAELNAKPTDRGLVVTLGDVLFASGGAVLKEGAAGNLRKLAAFLNKYPDRTVIIEGHTDSVGPSEGNVALSQRRAESVKTYLVGQGVAATRLSTAGKGEDTPVASNDSATGRQQNRRVDVIISNADVAKR